MLQLVWMALWQCSHFNKKGGFEIAYKEERYEKVGIVAETDSCISAITDDDFNQILLYDEGCFGFLRAQFLNLWIHLPENKTFKYKSGDSIKGYAVVRKVSVGY